MFKFTPAQQLAFMQGGYVHAGNGLFDLSKVHLFKGLNVNPPVTPLDLIEADFIGYTTPAPAWAPRVMPDLSSGFSAEESWTPTNGTVPNTIMGWYILDSASTILIGWEEFPTGFPMIGASSQLNLAMNIVVAQDSNFGFGTIS